MSQKAMVFIDGACLYRSRATLFARLGEANGFEIDYAKLPRLLCEDVANYLDEDISLVRTNYFGTIPTARSGFNTNKQSSFYNFLETACNYDVEIHDVDVTGANDARNDESWIKVALASSLLFYAAQPGTFDIAIILGDNLDYKPAIKRLRLMGKRVQLVGLHPVEGNKPTETILNKARISDFPAIYLDDHAAEIRLVRKSHARICQKCGREEDTTWAGPEFFCSVCRNKYRKPE